MNRYHLIELSDQPWFPSFLFRECLEFLQHFENVSNVFGAAAPFLRRALNRLGTVQIVDLCSGSGGPWPRLSRHLEEEEGLAVKVCLTDKDPDAGLIRTDDRFSGNGIACCQDPVDATSIPADMDGLMTFFNAFHHFDPDTAGDILHDAARKGRGIGIFEATERSFLSLLQMVFLLPLIVWALTPSIRPFRLSRLFWTYVIPLLPLVITFDGVVSSLRTYRPDELKQLAAKCNVPSYTWEAGTAKVKGLPRTITYLVGYPIDSIDYTQPREP